MTFLAWCRSHGGRTGPNLGRSVHRFCLDMAFSANRPRAPRWISRPETIGSVARAQYLEALRRWATPLGHSPSTVRKAWLGWQKARRP